MLITEYAVKVNEKKSILAITLNSIFSLNRKVPLKMPVESSVVIAKKLVL